MVKAKNMFMLLIMFSVTLFSTGERDSPAKIALFYPANFPFVDASPLHLEDLQAALKGYKYEVMSSLAICNQRLNNNRFNLLILAHGSAFPQECWAVIYRFIQHGGNLLVLGGAPFHQPILRGHDNTHWIKGVRQPAFAHKLLIGPAEPLAISEEMRSTLATKTYFNLPGRKKLSLRPSTTFSLTVRFTRDKEFPGEDGSTGPYLAVLRPLVHLISPHKIPLYCPVLEIDRIGGPEAGGRWILTPHDGPMPRSLLRACIQRAKQGASRLEVYPGKACMGPTEKQTIHIHYSRPGDRSATNHRFKALITIANHQGECFRKTVLLKGKLPFISMKLPIKVKKSLVPGLYTIVVSLLNCPWSPNQASNGFWIKDEKLLHDSLPLSVSKDWLRLGGKVLPIIGTSYMCSINQRKFLLYPNAARWNEDFSRMRREGINFVRTGIWTGWQKLLTSSGKISDSVLRALDAFVLSAANNGIHLCFTFFAFLPPNFGGTNPYLDPKSLEGQAAFIKQISQRYKGIHWIHYDLINEPSYAAPDDLWLTRPIGDVHELRWWQSWLENRHGKRIEKIKQLWQDPGLQPLTVPRKEDFIYRPIRSGHFPRKAFDFILFSQDIFQRWASIQCHNIKNTAGDVLVTVGQDEGGTGVRPGQQFFFPAVDYTSMHTWWYNDDLLWDGVVTKVPEKPNLISETGIMRLEDINGNFWRSPKESEKLLDRKFAYAFASRGAGVVQWLWNINPYQPLDNEAVIGIFRVDGTAKPELRVIQKYANFYTKAAPWLDDFSADDIAVILPHSRLFCGRPKGMDATKEVIRVLANHFHVVPMAISDQRLQFDRIRHCKMLILPAAEFIPEKTAKILHRAAEAGIKVLITGGISGTPYGRVTPALTLLGARARLPMLKGYENAPWRMDGFPPFPARYDLGSIQSLKKGLTRSLHIKDTNIILEPLPLEYSENKVPLMALLKILLQRANIPFHFNRVPLVCRTLYTDQVMVVILINESSQNLSHILTVAGKKITVAIPPAESQLILFNRATGEILASTEELSLRPL